jgi:Spy/CpxP family protein refolding chaperone
MISKIRIQKLILAIMMIGLNLVLAAGSIQAFGTGSRGHGNYGQGDNKSSEKNFLNLSPDQESKLKGLTNKFLDETMFVRNEIPVKLAELRTLWTEPKPDVDKINAKKKEIIELFSQLQIKATDNRMEAQTFLTPEQVEKLPVFGLHLEIDPNGAFRTKKF